MTISQTTELRDSRSLFGDGKALRAMIAEEGYVFLRGLIDPAFVTSLGMKGEVSLRFRYAWERNSVTNWNTDLMQAYMFQTLGQAQVAYYQATAATNPNYNVHLIGGSVAWAW